MGIYGQFEGGSDEWFTPKYIFDALQCEFDTDVAAPEDRTHVTTPAKNFITKDSLSLKWNGFVWMNPPFGKRNGLEPWLDKFFSHANGIALTPDRSSAPWFQKYAAKADLILFVSPKVKFIKPDGTKGDSPAGGTVLMARGSLACSGLKNGRANGLGLLARPVRQ